MLRTVLVGQKDHYQKLWSLLPPKEACNGGFKMLTKLFNRLSSPVQLKRYISKNIIWKFNWYLFLKMLHKAGLCWPITTQFTFREWVNCILKEKGGKITTWRISFRMSNFTCWTPVIIYFGINFIYTVSYKWPKKRDTKYLEGQFQIFFTFYSQGDCKWLENLEF